MLRWFSILSLSFFTSICWAQTELIIEPDRGPTPILQAIHNAKSSIDLVMYGFTDLQFADMLNNAKKNGRNVRVLLQHYPYKADSENKTVADKLQAYHISLIWPDGDFQLTHQKTLLTDHTNAIVMTFNFTHSTFKNERNFALKISDPNEIHEIQQVFDSDYQHKKISVHQPDLIWSPDNSRQKLLSLIQNAKYSIKIYAETLSDYQIIGALAKAAKNGVNISVITSTHDKKPNKKFTFLTHAGVIIYISKNYYIHAKVIIVDDKTAALGSINLTRASIDKNRELAVITHDHDVIEQLEKTFNNDSGEKKTAENKSYKTSDISVALIREIKQFVRAHKYLQRSPRHYPTHRKHIHHRKYLAKNMSNAI